MNDAECFDMLVQMRGDLRWNPIMGKWVCYPFEIANDARGGVFSSDPSPNVAVQKAHALWLAQERAKVAS